jgi:hypothetical protein
MQPFCRDLVAAVGWHQRMTAVSGSELLEDFDEG